MTRLRSTTSLLALALIVTASAAAHAEAPAALEGARTHAVIAGVLHWQDPGLSTFPTRHRKDQELHELLGKRGVPASQRTLLLDDEATTRAITAALDAAIARTGPGETLIFYYAGHGMRGANGEIVFASYDVASRAASDTGLTLSRLAKRFEGRFRGARVILLADCCYSGGLAAVAKALSAQGIDAVALTSAEASNVSTGNWTFTQTVIDAISGRPVCDRDANGDVTLQETADEVHDAMRHREQQRSGFAAYGVATSLILARARQPAPRRSAPATTRRFPVRSWVRVTGGAKDGIARVLARRPGALLASFYDYADETVAWTPLAHADVVNTPVFPVGTHLDVLWNGKRYEAKVLRVEDGFHLVTYPGWDSSWDEWVMGRRIVGLHNAESTLPKVKVEWRGRWWDAVIIGERDGATCIHYVGYDSSWDECVPPARIRRAAKDR